MIKNIKLAILWDLYHYHWSRSNELYRKGEFCKERNEREIYRYYMKKAAFHDDRAKIMKELIKR